MKENKGIKLVVLIITIVVILILVVATLIIGPNRIKNIIQNDGTLDKTWDNTKVANVVKETIGETEYKVPIPVGYTASKATEEDTIENGLVIYEGTEPVTDENVEKAKTTRNQFVWIPVNDISSMAVPQAKGLTNYRGVLYNWGSNSKGSTTYEWNTNSVSYREPANLSSDYDNSTNITGWTPVLYQDEFNSMVASVEKYKGFYVGRYETSILKLDKINSTEVKVVAGATEIGDETWYTIYENSKTLGVSGVVTSSMIWGCQWDQIMKTINGKKDGNKINTYYVCEANKTRHTGKIARTGANINDKVYNIYDFEGNVFEYTVEAYGKKFRALHGGCYNGGNTSVSYRSSNDPSECYINIRI